MRQIEKKGTNNNLFIMLHGTGGSADDLFGIGNIIDKDASYIGLEGEVLENGMRRWFERYPDGTFKLKSLARHSKTLYQEIEKIIEKYPDKDITVIGYSNGSNIFLNLLKEYENMDISRAMLFHPSPVREESPFKNQSLKVLITSGENDPFITKEQFEFLNKQLKDMNIETTTLTHELGHQLIQEELDVAMEFLKE